nr:ribonuclease H-like domain-containing protein [Tanacetum cinerariifolium]
MFSKMNYVIEARIDCIKAREIVEKNLDNVGRKIRIQVTDIVKEVEDYLKTRSSAVKEVEDYLKTRSSAGMDMSCHEGVPVQDPTLYRSLAGGLQYLTFTRPDISYAVQKIWFYMHDPREPHLATLKRILRYIRGTLDFEFHLYSSTTISCGYTAADWAGCPSTRRSTSGYCVFLGDNLLSWYSKRQQTISRSSAEAEYRGVVNVRHIPNPVQHQRTKHIEIDIHFVRDLVTDGHVRVLHVPSRYQYVDIFTKGLPSALFEDFRSSLSVRLPPVRTARAS